MYKAEISRSQPTVLLFMLDQSGSMDSPLGGNKEVVMQKAQAAADAINRILQEFVVRCTNGHEIRNYFDIGVIGYGKTSDWVGPVLEGTLAGRDLVTIGDVGNNPAKLEEREKLVPDGAGGVVKVKVPMPFWFSPVSGHNTPMCKALEYAHGLLEGWISNHRSSFPPIVVNITDGESTDGDPTIAAQKLTSLSTDDGNILLYNCHLSSTASPAISFVDSDKGLPDQYARQMFNISSVFPEISISYAASLGLAFTPMTRGFVFNSDFVQLVKFLDIGTRTNPTTDK